MNSVAYRGSVRWFGIAALAACITLRWTDFPSASRAAEAGADAALSYRETAPGLLERTIFKGPDTAGASVEIIDIMVGPGQVAERLAVESGSLLDVQAGNAVLAVDGRRQEARPGRVLALEPGQTLSIDNQKQQRPFVARLIRFTGSMP